MRRLVLFFCLVHFALSVLPQRTYLMKIDVFNGRKPAEFTIYDKETNARVYRIESYGFFQPQSVNLIAYPSKQVVGKFISNVKNHWREVTFQVFDNKTRKWKSGNFIQNLIGFYKHSIDIDWDGLPLNCEIDKNGLAGRFLAADNSTLANFKRESWKNFWPGKYEVEIYSNDIPDSLYLLYTANFHETAVGLYRG